MNKVFLQELENSLYIHRPLPLHKERSAEANFAKKRVLNTKPLFNKKTKVSSAQITDKGVIAQSEDTVSITAMLRSNKWPKGATADGDYSNFGTAGIRFSFGADNWETFNRLAFFVRPQINGARIAHVNVSIKNIGKIPLPDSYFREGATVFDLEPNRWNECFWEFEAMPRDAICELTFYVFLSGHDVGANPELVYEYKDIVLEKVEAPEHEHGWQRQDKAVNISSEGYWPKGKKTAVGSIFEKSFSLVDVATKKTVFTENVIKEENPRGIFAVYDFTEFTTQGQYYLQVGSYKSCEFSIQNQLCKESLWKLINFLYCERCGTPVQGKHGSCHLDIMAKHNETALSFGGGWHDAGDVSQQAAQTGETVHALFENAMNCKDDKLLYLRLMEEAQWGLDFILRTRFNDGYRATSAGATRITNNLVGDFDDIQARVHNHSYENFLFSGIEAFSAICLKDYDEGLAWQSLSAAKADFAFAEDVFLQTGVQPAHMFEHTYNSGLSQYYAVITLAASYLFEATNENAYAQKAAKYASLLVACQEQGESDAPIVGFFYRDETHKIIVHFNHQSREQQFMQALTAVCRTQPNAEEKDMWENAIKLYGNYIKKISSNTAPYGMLPAGIHKTDEANDMTIFPYLHVTCNYENEYENYVQQLKKATPLSEDYVLRNFPVWFSFRGNTAIMLSMGKAASIAGKYLNDIELLQIGREQLYWMWGKNPFGHSLIYGVGSNYCRQYAVLCGECVGEVPVGVETRDNEDIPYWPQNNNATFREVWIGAACRWLWLCADYVQD